jgi:hypothetical protein
VLLLFRTYCIIVCKSYLSYKAVNKRTHGQTAGRRERREIRASTYRSICLGYKMIIIYKKADGQKSHSKFFFKKQDDPKIMKTYSTSTYIHTYYFQFDTTSSIFLEGRRIHVSTVVVVLFCII